MLARRVSRRERGRASGAGPRTPPQVAGGTLAAAPHRAAAARHRHQHVQRAWLVPVRTVGPYGHLLRNIRPRGAPKTTAPTAESTDLGRHAGEHAGTGPF